MSGDCFTPFAMTSLSLKKHYLCYINAKIGGASAIKISKLILYCSQLALPLPQICYNNMMTLIQYKDELYNTLQKNAVVKKFYLFGSALTSRFDENNSDIDVLVETTDLLPEEKGELLLVLWENLEELFNCKVDLLTEHSLRNPYLTREIEQTKKLIYDGQSGQIFI